MLLRPWTGEELAEFEREETWDFDHVIVHESVEISGTQVRVNFPTHKFGAIAKRHEAGG